MADTGNAKTPTPNATKTQDGSRKKRRKHKKSAESSVDGAPSTKSVQLKSSHASTSQPQTSSEGATGSSIGDKCSSPSEKKTSKQEKNAMTVIEPVGKLSSNPTDKDKSELVGKLSSNLTDKDKTEVVELLASNTTDKDKTEVVELLASNTTGKDRSRSEVPGKNLRSTESKENKIVKDVKIGGGHLEKTVKQEIKDRAHCEHSPKSASKQTGLLFDREKKDIETSWKGEEHQKGNVLEKPGQNLKEKAKFEKVAATIDLQKATVKAKAEARKTSNLGAEHRQLAKGDPEKKLEVGGGEQKSKAQLRAERRAVQEAQRAAKKGEAGGDSLGGAANCSSAATAGKKDHVGDKSKSAADVMAGEKNRKKPAGELTGGDKNWKKTAGELTGGEKNKKKAVETAVIQAETEEEMWTKKENEILGKSLNIDNSIMSLGFQYFHHNIVGANARCMALLATLKEVITKYKTPVGKELSRDLEKNFLNPCISYINYCRPISTSMGNAIRHLKYHISNIKRDVDDETAISGLIEVIDNFIEVNIIKAAQAVAHYAITKIDDGDVILVYAASSLIGQVLKKAFNSGKKFRVIVVEGRPRSEGKSMLRYLVRCGIPCSYIYIGSASHAMSETTKVFLGAAAMFAIGDLYSRSGNSMIAALAKANNIPVLVCCETYKFTDKVQLHTGDSNLHARGKDLVSIGHKTPILANWEEIGLRLLNLMYDVTGSEYITAVVTELGMLPCTSVPVVLRRQEDNTIG